MTPENINIINDNFLLHYNKVLQYFNDKNNVLNITVMNGGNLEIDFNVIKDFIDKMSDKPNLYGLLTKTNGSDWNLRYVGQRKAKDITQRLRQHLIKKNQKTGAQLDKVKKELNSNVQLGIKLTSISPDELRHYYEEKLLKDIETLDWNIQK